jgi:ligand-binding SRPBCC domain-containing protein
MSLLKFRHKFMVNANVDTVWKFYTDIHHLDLITPPDVRIRIVQSSHEQLVEGSDVWLAGRLMSLEIK